VTDIESHEWEQVRAQGRDRFVLREGVLQRGLRDAGILALVWVFFHIFRHKPLPSPVDAWTSIAGLCVVALGAGSYEGVTVWERREAEYQEHQKGNHVG
jgi:hypothetical protein